MLFNLKSILTKKKPVVEQTCKVLFRISSSTLVQLKPELFNLKKGHVLDIKYYSVLAVFSFIFFYANQRFLWQYLVFGDTLYREIFAPDLFSALSTSLSAGEFMTGKIPMFHGISLVLKCVWANFRRGETIYKCRRAKITRD